MEKSVPGSESRPIVERTQVNRQELLQGRGARFVIQRRPFEYAFIQYPGSLVALAAFKKKQA